MYCIQYVCIQCVYIQYVCIQCVYIQCMYSTYVYMQYVFSMYSTLCTKIPHDKLLEHYGYGQKIKLDDLTLSKKYKLVWSL